jgi:nucleoside 2-deoxyribosyltransferase
MKIYVASPYSHGNQAENVRASLDACEAIANAGGVPFCPLFSHFWHFVYPHPWEFWMKQDLEWVEACDALLRLPGISTGADREVEYALSLGKPVVYSVEDAIALCNI